MKCPHCGSELELNNAAVWNVEAYGDVVLAVTLCCGKGVNLVPMRTFTVEQYEGNRVEDDWGNPIQNDQLTSLPKSV